MSEIMFSIIVVCLNPGEKINITMESILSQTFGGYEVILKDGGSTDGSVEPWRDKTVFVQGEDSGIYDAMNRAISNAGGDFFLFLNCGDTFADDRVLERTASFIGERISEKKDVGRMVFYGDTYSGANRALIASAPSITGFTCYRNIPCHQSCFYGASLCREKPYDLSYRIRADYDHFLWCYYRAGAGFAHMGFAVSSYEGGGYSESRENKKRDKEEHRLITRTYMKKSSLLLYRTLMACTFSSLRSAAAESRFFSSWYHKIKRILYKKG